MVVFALALDGGWTNQHQHRGDYRPFVLNEAWKQQLVCWMSGGWRVGKGQQGQARDVGGGDSILDTGYVHVHIQKCHPAQM